jgi:anti-anti-sigma factor
MGTTIVDPALQIGTAKDGVTIVYFTQERLDTLTVATLSSDILSLPTPEQPIVIFDFTNVTHISSSLLSLLLQTRRQALRVQGEIRLCNLDAYNRQMFVVTHLITLFGIHDTQADAVAACNS